MRKAIPVGLVPRVVAWLVVGTAILAVLAHLSTSSKQSVAARYLPRLRLSAGSDYLHGHVHQYPSTEEPETIWSLAPLEETHVLEKNGRHLIEQVPYGISLIQADDPALPDTLGPQPVTVCLVDSGLDVTHPDIPAHLVTGSDRTSKVDGSLLEWKVDHRQHGTHLAGIVSAIGKNDVGVRGIADIPLHVTRSMNDQGQAFPADIREAIEQCGDSKIIALSLGAPSMPSFLWDLLDDLFANDTLVFAAAGNHNVSTPTYPAAHPGVIAVTAVDESMERWDKANKGTHLELAAPGKSILSTVPGGGYATYSGTSMAVPHAAGAAALLWSHFPDCSSHQIRYALAYSAMDLGTEGCDDRYGYGLVQVKDAFDFLTDHDCAGANWGQKPSSGFCGTINAEPIIVDPTSSRSTGFGVGLTQFFSNLLFEPP